MKRGEIWLVSLDPVIGNEANKCRPAVIMSSDASNEAVAKLGRGMVSVVPLTSSSRRVLPFQVLMAPDGSNGLSQVSKAHAEQIRSVDSSRLMSLVGQLRREDLEAVAEAIRLHLDLE